LGGEHGFSLLLKVSGRLKFDNPKDRLRFQTTFGSRYSGLNLNQDKATKPQTVQLVRQGEVTLSWFKVNPLYLTSAGRLKPQQNGQTFLKYWV